MAFNNIETSRDGAAPVELYLFTYGSDASAFIANTDAEMPIILDGVTYNPLPIKRAGIKAKSRPERADMSLDVPLSSRVADLFRVYPPGRVVTVVIRSGHILPDGTAALWDDGANWPVVWTGRVLEGNRGPDKAVLTCEAGSASMRRLGLRRNYQWPCPHPLYGSKCRADKVAATITVSVAQADGNRVTLTSGWMPQVDDSSDPPVQVDKYFPASYVGGLMKWTTDDGVEERSILRADSADEFVLTGPAFGLAANDTVELSLGCPHTLAGCGLLHGNLPNYGGQPFIPTFNPLNKNNHT